MSERLKVEPEPGLVRVSLQGKTSMMLSIEAVLRAVHAAQKAGVNAILFDIRDTETDEFHSRIVKLAAEAPRMGTSNYRMAILGKEGDPRLAFIEDVGKNRGFKVRAFSDDAAARAWLASEA